MKNFYDLWSISGLCGGVGMIFSLLYTDFAKSHEYISMVIMFFTLVSSLALVGITFKFGSLEIRKWWILEVSLGCLLGCIPKAAMIIFGLFVRHSGEKSIQGILVFYFSAWFVLSCCVLLKPSLDIGAFNFLCSMGAMQAYMMFEFQIYTWLFVALGLVLHLFRAFLMKPGQSAAEVGEEPPRQMGVSARIEAILIFFIYSAVHICIFSTNLADKLEDIVDLVPLVTLPMTFFAVHFVTGLYWDIPWLYRLGRYETGLFLKSIFATVWMILAILIRHVQETSFFGIIFFYLSIIGVLISCHFTRARLDIGLINFLCTSAANQVYLVYGVEHPWICFTIPAMMGCIFYLVAAYLARPPATADTRDQVGPVIGAV